MKEKYLPVGTVVLLKDATKKVMIVGYFPMDEKKEVYDYTACVYPEGILSPDKSLAFNHNQIKEIIHMGLEDAESKKINEELKKMIEWINNIKDMKLPENNEQETA